ncbi:MAG: hypothetical protein M3458_22285 [Acidobacteriota bacterium]|nr:hypothetical protein [Acidobacteriota bacterium]
MRKKIFSLILAVSAALCSAQESGAPDKWHIADAATTRLLPNAFPQLPRMIMHNLQSLGCTVPQSYGNSVPHNVISGEFTKKGQKDWAILCSKNKVSSILVFWGASTKSVAKIAKAEDHQFLQGIDGAGNIGFSRAIDVVDRNYILEHYKEYGGPKPPPINHQGIDDGFQGKASTVLYYYRGKWLKLQGAD